MFRRRVLERIEVAAVSALLFSLRSLVRQQRRCLIFVVLLCVSAGLAPGGWWLHAFESATKAQQPAAELVGTVDEADLLKAGSNDSNWLMYGRTYNAHPSSPP